MPILVGGGVESFFVISSFFLVNKFWGNDEVDVKRQFKLRIARLYPAYMAVLMAAVLYAVLKRQLPYDLIPHLLSIQNFQWMITDYSSPMQRITAHTWTLSIEVWTGLIWLVLLRIIPKNKFRAVMWIALLAGSVYRIITIYLGCDIWIISLCPLAHIDAFACGSLLAVSVKEGSVKKSMLTLVGIIGIIGIILCILTLAYSNNINFLEGYKLLSRSKNYLNGWITGNIYFFISFFTVSVLGWLYMNERCDKVEKHSIYKLLIILGDESYVLYLFHWPILIVARHFYSFWGFTVPIVFFSSLMSCFIFKRIMIFIKKLFKGRKIF